MDLGLIWEWVYHFLALSGFSFGVLIDDTYGFVDGLELSKGNYNPIACTEFAILKKMMTLF
jgi:hypothetical protein